MTTSPPQERRCNGLLLTGLLALAAAPLPTSAQVGATVPKGASVSGNTWCRIVIAQDPGPFQEQVVALIDAGGQVQGATMTMANDQGVSWFALVCGPVRKG
jgi:hypothetical protein